MPAARSADLQRRRIWKSGAGSKYASQLSCGVVVWLRANIIKYAWWHPLRPGRRSAPPDCDAHLYTCTTLAGDRVAAIFEQRRASRFTEGNWPLEQVVLRSVSHVWRLDQKKGRRLARTYGESGAEGFRWHMFEGGAPRRDVGFERQPRLASRSKAGVRSLGSDVAPRGIDASQLRNVFVCACVCICVSLCLCLGVSGAPCSLKCDSNLTKMSGHALVGLLVDLDESWHRVVWPYVCLFGLCCQLEYGVHCRMSAIGDLCARRKRRSSMPQGIGTSPHSARPRSLGRA